MPCMVGRAHVTGLAMMKLPAGLDDECRCVARAAKMVILSQDWWCVTFFPQ